MIFLSVEPENEVTKDFHPGLEGQGELKRSKAPISGLSDVSTDRTVEDGVALVCVACLGSEKVLLHC